MSVFEGTAFYYDKYRPGVPGELIQTILDNLDTEPEKLLDLGPATGNVLEQFAPYFQKVIAVEPDKDMLELAKKRLTGKGVSFINVRAEDFTLPDRGQVSLVTIGRALHWMDQDKVISHLDKMVEPLGAVAVFGDRSIWRSNDSWKEAARKVVQQFLGEERRAGESRFTNPDKKYQDIFKAYAFSDIKTYTFPVERPLSINEFIGLLYSTSFANKKLLGSRVEEFETTMKTELGTLTDGGQLIDHNEFELIIAKRPK